MNNTAQAAWEIIQSRGNESIYHRIGRAITGVIASDVAAIEVFDRNGNYAERRWSNPDMEISRGFDSFLAHRFSHPLFKEFVISGLRSPVRISDCVGDRGFRATGMFNEFFRPLGISTQMAVALPSDSMGTPVLALARAKSDYSATEKRVLAALIPKIRSQIAAEQTWAHYDLLIRQLLLEGAAVAIVVFHEYVVHAAPQVFDVLDRHLPGSVRHCGQLPPALVELLRARTRNDRTRYTFASEDAQSSLTVSVCDSENGDQQILSFREIESPRRKLASRFELSSRLVDVLLLIEEGRSNKQMAELLGLSPNTVRTQVEKVLHRMEVSNRTQAAAMARRCIDDA